MALSVTVQSMIPFCIFMNMYLLSLPVNGSSSLYLTSAVTVSPVLYVLLMSDCDSTYFLSSKGSYASQL